MPYPQKALSEIERVLKNDSILIAPTFIHDEGFGFYLRICLMELIGFHIFYKWNSLKKSFSSFRTCCHWWKFNTIMLFDCTKGKRNMKILVYGAGVLGCELSHILLKSIHEITLFARGKWKENIDKNGLIIRHYVQCHTTKERINTIDFLSHDDHYDLIFIPMQCSQLDDVISILAANCSQKIIFIGNNGQALETERKLQSYSAIPKEIAFAFQTTGGRRENGKVISIYMNRVLTIGGSQNALSKDFQEMLKNAFKNTSCQLEWENQMDAWLKCHLAFILPICYVCYSVDGHLSKATRDQRKALLDAVNEGYQVLKALHIPILPQGDDLYFQDSKKRKMMEAMIFVMMKTPIGRLAASDHAMHAVIEMKMLDSQFEVLCQRSHVNMPNWILLKNQMKSWYELEKQGK